MSDKPSPLKVNCPTCQNKVTWSEASTYRPFCSERCQQIDLGAWATEAYAIPAEPADEWSEHSNTMESESPTLQ